MSPAGPASSERRRSLRLGLFLALACAALLGHFAQVAHFAGVVHVVGADGKLYHSGHDHGDPARGGEPQPGEPEPEGDPCPWLPPGLEPCGDDAGAAAPPTVESRSAELPPRLLLLAADRLAVAPKTSPPQQRRS